jgi:K+-sensing histidine kinase KdpD
MDPLHAALELQPNELEAFYNISKIVSEEVDVDKALERIIRIARNVLVFDSAVVYIRDKEKEPEAVFARAIGRGKSSGHRLPWGEAPAKETFRTGKVFINEARADPSADRLDQHFYLSLPMLIGGAITGALVFIRFGGPSYEEQHIKLAEFITTHISHLFEHKRLVEQIADLQAQQRLAQYQDEFIAMVSHELKTPLGFIKGYTTTLLRDDTTWDPQTQQEFLTIIDEETDRLSEQIENLLDSFRLKSRLVVVDLKPFSLSSFFQSIIGKLANQEINLEINLQIEPSQLEVLADRKMLAQVVTNLISNASKYAPNSILEIKAVQITDSIQLEFKDNGPGIPEVHLKKIFDQFYRVPERSGGVRGAGLGLYICKQIIDAHNGEIRAESTVGQGTNFLIKLPILRDQGEG